MKLGFLFIATKSSLLNVDVKPGTLPGTEAQVRGGKCQLGGGEEAVEKGWIPSGQNARVRSAAPGPWRELLFGNSRQVESTANEISTSQEGKREAKNHQANHMEKSTCEGRFRGTNRRRAGSLPFTREPTSKGTRHPQEPRCVYLLMPFEVLFWTSDSQNADPTSAVEQHLRSC